MSALFIILALAQDTSTTLERIEKEVAAVVEKARKSVVDVTATLGDEKRRLSGIVFSADGHILSDAGGLEKAVEVRVVLRDGRELVAKIVGTDARTGVAVLKVDVDKLTPAEFAGADRLRPGIHAIVVATSFGMKDSAEVGYVAGLGRAIQVGGRRFDDMIQMTTRVHPGNCGGFVADSRGRLIGMVHSAFLGEKGDTEQDDLFKLFAPEMHDLLAVRGQRLSFATPACEARFVAERIIRFGRMVRGWAGLTVRPLDEATRAQLSVPPGEGCEVWSVDAEGPAAGVVRRRDVLLRVADRPVSDIRALKRWIEDHDKPETVKVAFLRAGARQEADLQIKIGD